MLQFAGDEAPRTRNRWTERLLIDDAFDAYLEWRDESAEVWHAYKRWNGAPAREARRKFWAYRAALEREEHAARVRDLRAMLDHMPWVRAVMWSQLPSRGQAHRAGTSGLLNGTSGGTRGWRPSCAA